MYCRNCGKEVAARAVACPGCGVPPLAERHHCHGCGAATEPNQAMCTRCGVGLLSTSASGESKKIPAALLAIFLGGLGVHKFYLGCNTAGVVTLLATVVGGLCTCGVAAVVMWTITFIEGIVYLTKSDEEFDRLYVQSKKAWF